MRLRKKFGNSSPSSTNGGFSTTMLIVAGFAFGASLALILIALFTLVK
jgi:hypothetical protein